MVNDSSPVSFWGHDKRHDKTEAIIFDLICQYVQKQPTCMVKQTSTRFRSSISEIGSKSAHSRIVDHPLYEAGGWHMQRGVGTAIH